MVGAQAPIALLSDSDASLGDDCVAVKGNTTNLYVRNVTCYGSGGMPIGSIGQYPTEPDYVENVLFEDIVLHDASSAGWIKTWAGEPALTSSNGDNGGGGTGYVKNVTWKNIHCNNVSQPIYVTQCTYGYDSSICDTSTVRTPHSSPNSLHLQVNSDTLVAPAIRHKVAEYHRYNELQRRSLDPLLSRGPLSWPRVCGCEPYVPQCYQRAAKLQRQ